MEDLHIEKEKLSICLCIVTYNRCLVIKDFMEKCASYYLGAGIDIYIYDSSDNDNTKQVLDKWEDENKERVYYVRVPSDLHANMKVYKIWQFYGLKREYDFIWMSGDVLQFFDQGIRIIVENLRSEYDLIELDIYDKGDIGYRLYTKSDEFFVENAWKTSYFGTIILNTHTFLTNVEWNYYETKYSKKKFINYSHVSFYFNRIQELNSFQCMHLPLCDDFAKSVYKKEAGWRKNTFQVLCKGGVSTIKELPDCYTNKKKAMLDLGVNSVFYNADAFRKLKKEGIYSFKIFMEYFLTWRKVCNVKYWELFMIAALSGEAEKKILNQIVSGKLRRFGRRHKFLYLYGAGIVGERCGKYLSQNGIKYTGYLVTRISANKAILDNHPVLEIDKLERCKEIGIIVCVSESLSGEVMRSLREYGYGKQVYYCNGLHAWIRSIMQN